MALHLKHRARPFCARQRIAYAPARHRVGLGERPGDAESLAKLCRKLGRAENFGWRIDDAQVTFIGDNIDAALGQDFHTALELSGRDDATRWIARRTQDNELRVRSDGTLDLLRVENAVRLFRVDIDLCRSGVG